jgi:hypothetical protein
MASTSTSIDAATQPASAVETGRLLVSLPPLANGELSATLRNLAAAFPERTVLVATPSSLDGAQDPVPDTLRILSYRPTSASAISWILTAADYVNAFRLAEENQATACLLLGAEPQSIAPESLRALSGGVLDAGADLAIAHYDTGPHELLVNSAILYPVSRALFTARPRFPLAIDLALSLRMAGKLAATAQKFISLNQSDALIWPVAEAASVNYAIQEIEIGSRTMPQPAAADLNSLLAQIAGSLFSEVDAKAAFWQRARGTQPARPVPLSAFPAEAADIAPMLDAFHLAYTNLHGIWSLVLPPNSLLGLKRLSIMPSGSFHMPDNLWARIIYDFILAYRLRTINRGHLLGALTPLYLAWVASHLVLTGSGTPPEKHIQDLAAAFETDKPYLVSRWRWPDRFNP